MKSRNRGIYTRESSYFMNKDNLMIDFMVCNEIGNNIKNKKMDNFDINKDYIMRNSFTSENIDLKKKNALIADKKTSPKKRVNRVDDSVTYEYVDFLVSVDVKNMKNF